MGRTPKEKPSSDVIASSVPTPLPPSAPAPGVSVNPSPTDKGEGVSGSTPPGAPGVNINELRGEARDEKERRKYKKRRPKSSEPSEPDPDTVRYIQGFQLFSDLTLNLICARMPVAKPPTTTEMKAWNEATSRVMEKYLPMLGQYKEEAALVAVAAIIFLPRSKFALKKSTPTPTPVESVAPVAVPPGSDISIPDPATSLPGSSVNDRTAA